MELSFPARGMMEGEAEGNALVSKRAFTFAHGVNPSTGEVTDGRSDLRGKNVRGRVLFFPYGKGSTTASSWFLETVRCGNSPAALATESVDLSVVIGSVLARTLYSKSIPVVSGFPKELYSAVEETDLVRVDGGKGTITVRRP